MKPGFDYPRDIQDSRIQRNNFIYFLVRNGLITQNLDKITYHITDTDFGKYYYCYNENLDSIVDSATVDDNGDLVNLLDDSSISDINVITKFDLNQNFNK